MWMPSCVLGSLDSIVESLGGETKWGWLGLDFTGCSSNGVGLGAGTHDMKCGGGLVGAWFAYIEDMISRMWGNVDICSGLVFLGFFGKAGRGICNGCGAREVVSENADVWWLGLVDDHIELWVWYMWHFRKSFDDWSMVSCYFLTLLLQDSMPLFYATDEIYPLAWRDVEQVFIPINEPKRHWSLAQFHIQSGNVTFYDSQKTYDPEFRPWYVRMRSCLESKLLVVLQQTGVFASKGIDPTSYSIKFTNAQNVPKQGGVFGDCGVFVCLFLYRLAHGIPLDVEDPIQTALAYREKM
ncbi:phospholipase-like protein, partial [Tanacetum coccineum]